jgi:hypothetical protein
VPVICYARPLLVWRVQDVRGQFRDDWYCRAGDAVRDHWT